MGGGGRAFGLLLARAVLLGPVLLATAAVAAQAPGPPTARACTCRANGRSYELGERACVQGPAGWRIAECRLAQNVTSWAFGPEECSVSAALGLPALPAGRAGSAARPVAGSHGRGEDGG